MITTCSHGVLWSDNCSDCENLELEEFLGFFGTLVDNARKRLGKVTDGTWVPVAKVAPSENFGGPSMHITIVPLVSNLELGDVLYKLK